MQPSSEPKEVFISYSGSDANIAKVLCAILEKEGVTCWIAPRDLPPGSNFAVELLRAIDAAHAVALVFSPQANASPFVLTEVNRAFSRGKAIFAFRTEDALPAEDLEFYLARHQWTDGFPPPLEIRAGYLASAIRAFLGKGAPPLVPDEGRRANPDNPGKTSGRAFDENGKLRFSEFAFPLSSVLLRTAKRRNIAGRAQASLTDFIAGLIRVGGLTRFVLKRAGCVPDELYAKLRPRASHQAAPESEVPIKAGPPDKDEAEQALTRWVLTQRTDFDPALATLIEKAATVSSSRITELDVLEKLLGSPAWESAGISLPDPIEVRRILDERRRTGEVDENGGVPLHDLTPGAREVILHAHTLARHCQTAEITHRLLMAAFVSEAEGRYGASLCRAAGVDTRMLWALLVCISRKEDNAPAVVTDACLTPAVCERVVIPVLQKAKELACDPTAITEAELFRAFCLTARRGFVEFLRSPAEGDKFEAMETDLDEINNQPPDSSNVLAGLTLRSRHIVRTAHRLAQELGMCPIPNRLVLAAFFAGPVSFASRLIAARGLTAASVHESLLAASKGSGPLLFELDDKACARVITPMLERARELAGADALVTERLLFQAYCDVAPPEFKAGLKSVGIDLDLLRGSDLEGTSTQKKSENTPSAQSASPSELHGLN